MAQQPSQNDARRTAFSPRFLPTYHDTDTATTTHCYTPGVTASRSAPNITRTVCQHPGPTSVRRAVRHPSAVGYLPQRVNENVARAAAALSFSDSSLVNSSRSRLLLSCVMVCWLPCSCDLADHFACTSKLFLAPTMPTNSHFSLRQLTSYWLLAGLVTSTLFSSFFSK